MEKTNEIDRFEAALGDGVAATYAKMAVEVATIMARVENMIEGCEILMDKMHDDGAPYFDLREAHNALGKALASIVSYTGCYAGNKEGNDDNQD